jgi:hypothetical protein
VAAAGLGRDEGSHGHEAAECGEHDCAVAEASAGGLDQREGDARQPQGAEGTARHVDVGVDGDVGRLGRRATRAVRAAIARLSRKMTLQDTASTR